MAAPAVIVVSNSRLSGTDARNLLQNVTLHFHRAYLPHTYVRVHHTSHLPQVACGVFSPRPSLVSYSPSCTVGCGTGVNSLSQNAHFCHNSPPNVVLPPGEVLPLD